MPVLIVPPGSTEQFDPHYPLDTRIRSATFVAKRFAGDELLVLARSVRADGEHTNWSETVSAGTTVPQLVGAAFGRSARDRVTPLVFDDAHPGKVDAVAEADLPRSRAGSANRSRSSTGTVRGRVRWTWACAPTRGGMSW